MAHRTNASGSFLSKFGFRYRETVEYSAGGRAALYRVLVRIITAGGAFRVGGVSFLSPKFLVQKSLTHFPSPQKCHRAKQ